jgi:hypothetical protein
MGSPSILKYDVFVSYRWVDPDSRWVRNQLVPALKRAGLKVCLDVNDFVPGRNLIREMSRAGIRSRHALCILSPDYFAGDKMVDFEILESRRLDPSGEQSRRIPLLLRQSEIPEWLGGLVCIDWTDPNDRAREWNKLLKVLEAPSLTAPPPGGVELVGPTAKQTEPKLERMPRFWPALSLIRVNGPVARWQIWSGVAVFMMSSFGALASTRNLSGLPAEVTNALVNAQPKLLSIGATIESHTEADLNHK